MHQTAESLSARLSRVGNVKLNLFPLAHFLPHGLHYIIPETRPAQLLLQEPHIVLRHFLFHRIKFYGSLRTLNNIFDLIRTRRMRSLLFSRSSAISSLSFPITRGAMPYVKITVESPGIVEGSRLTNGRSLISWRAVRRMWWRRRTVNSIQPTRKS